jgi:hypothetical protein
MSVAPPQLPCRELPAFDAGNLAAVQAAFASAAGCELRQTWRPAPEPDFAAATVRTGWRGNALLVFAELTDADIFSRATGHNQRMWELGDVLEIFLSPENSASYVEFHVTPDNYRLQLRFPDTATLRRAQAENRFEHLLLPDGVFQSRTWLQPENKKWFILAEIPATVVGDAAAPQPGVRWKFSFSRFDGARGRTEPICSSTSPHPSPDYHRREDWGTLIFLTDNL